jgi:hypothetical protein
VICEISVLLNHHSSRPRRAHYARRDLDAEMRAILLTEDGVPMTEMFETAILPAPLHTLRLQREFGHAVVTFMFRYVGHTSKIIVYTLWSVS